MEVAPFYAAAQACNVHAIWIGHISDCLGKEWKDWNIDREEMSRISADICYESVSLLSEHR
jgi:hypothetical protein